MRAIVHTIVGMDSRWQPPGGTPDEHDRRMPTPSPEPACKEDGRWAAG